MLQVLAVPNCGWTDLGTPKRIGITLQRILDAETTSPHRPHVAPYLNLAHQYDQLLRGSRIGQAPFSLATRIA
jgi:hypothetical protein